MAPNRRCHTPLPVTCGRGFALHIQGAPKGLIQAVRVQRAAALRMLVLELAAHLLQESKGQLPANPLVSNHKIGCMARSNPSGWYNMSPGTMIPEVVGACALQLKEQKGVWCSESCDGRATAGGEF